MTESAAPTDAAYAPVTAHCAGHGRGALLKHIQALFCVYVSASVPVGDDESRTVEKMMFGSVYRDKVAFHHGYSYRYGVGAFGF